MNDPLTIAHTIGDLDLIPQAMSYHEQSHTWLWTGSRWIVVDCNIMHWMKGGHHED